MAHSIINNTGSAGNLSATVTAAAGAHVYALINATGSAVTATLHADTDVTWNPDYEAGGVNLGSSYQVKEHSTRRIYYRIPAGATVLAEITVPAGTTAGLTLENTSTTHKTSSSENERLWLAQV